MHGKRHPISGATYEARPDGNVLVVAREGSSGVFTVDGAWIEGKLRCADPHMCGWVAGPRIGESRDSSRPASMRDHTPAREPDQ